MRYPKFEKSWSSLKRKQGYIEGCRAKDNPILSLGEDKKMRYRSFDKNDCQQIQFQAMLRCNIDGCFRSASLRLLDLRTYKEEVVDFDGVSRIRCSISCFKNKSHQEGALDNVALHEMTACFSCGCPIGQAHDPEFLVNFFATTCV